MNHPLGKSRQSIGMLGLIAKGNNVPYYTSIDSYIVQYQ